MANAIVIIATLDQITNIRIGAGSNSFNDGTIPGIHLFDFVGRTIDIGKSNGDKTQKGEEHTISVDHRLLSENGAAQAGYMSVVQEGNDALCISYITATISSGVQYAWNGDIGFQCGAFWMFGNTTWTADGVSGIYQPRCNWIDGDDSNGLHTKAMGIHLPSFLANEGRVAQYNADTDVMCKADPRFKLYDELDVKDPIPYFKSRPFDLDTLIDYNRDQTLDPAGWDTVPVDEKPLQGIEKRRWSKSSHGQTPSQVSKSKANCAAAANTTMYGSDSAASKGEQSSDCSTKNSGGNSGNSNVAGNAKISKRTAPKQNAKHRGQLIKSSSQYHSAMELCGSMTSYGPDFVSVHEGVFCDMDQKTTWPLSQNAMQVACFDNTANKMRLGTGNSRRDDKGVLLPRKVYTNVDHW